MNKVNSKIRKVVRTILLMIVLIGYQQEVHAQWSFDVPSIEAYINDHKKQRSLLWQSTLEYSNKLLHEYSSKETVKYKELKWILISTHEPSM